MVNQDNPEFEINVYDKKGTHIRTIRKDFQNVRIPQAYKAEKEKSYKESTPYRVHKWEPYIDEYFPAIQNFYVDNSGRIFVETYEEADIESDVILNIFTSQGIYVGRISQKKTQRKIYSNNRLYAIYEMDSGYQKLEVSKIIWK